MINLLENFSKNLSDKITTQDFSNKEMIRQITYLSHNPIHALIKEQKGKTNSYADQSERAF